jgi:hypothetical protein
MTLVEVPTLLVEERADENGLQRARSALGALPGDADLTPVVGLGEVVVAESAYRAVADVAGRWFRQHFAAAADSPTWRSVTRSLSGHVPDGSSATTTGTIGTGHASRLR